MIIEIQTINWLKVCVTVKLIKVDNYTGLAEENILIPRKWTVKYLRVNKNDMKLTLNLISKKIYIGKKMTQLRQNVNNR